MSINLQGESNSLAGHMSRDEREGDLTSFGYPTSLIACDVAQAALLCAELLTQGNSLVFDMY